jgi:hypothetical protein
MFGVIFAGILFVLAVLISVGVWALLLISRYRGPELTSEGFEVSREDFLTAARRRAGRRL